MTEDTKKCPYCNENINLMAKKCKHCKEDIPQQAPSVNSVKTVTTTLDEKKEKELTFGYELSALVIISLNLLSALISFACTDNLRAVVGFGILFSVLLPLVISIIGLQNKNKGLNIVSLVLTILTAIFGLILIISVS